MSYEAEELDALTNFRVEAISASPRRDRPQVHSPLLRQGLRAASSVDLGGKIHPALRAY